MDFALVQGDIIEHIIEAKVADRALSKALVFFQRKYNLKATQVLLSLPQEYQVDGLSVMKAQHFLETLML